MSVEHEGPPEADPAPPKEGPEPEAGSGPDPSEEPGPAGSPASPEADTAVAADTFTDPGGPPPPPEKASGGRSARRLGVVAVVVAVVVVGGVAFAALNGGGSGKKPARPSGPPSSWVQQARQQLAAVPGLLYEGTLPASGQPVRLRLKVTGKGAATGSLTTAGASADLVSIDGTTYVKAGRAFWREFGAEPARADDFADRWAKAPAVLSALDVRDVLGPEAAARLLARAPAKPPTENLGGVPAFKIKTRRADYFLTAAAPYRLLAVQTAGNGDPRFTATAITAPAPLFAELRRRVAALRGAVDPALRFRPGKLNFINCNENTSGCTVSVPATLTRPEGQVPQDARAALRATITSNGRPLGTCTEAGPVPANRQLVLRCTVTGRAWRVWMRQALETPGAHPYAAQARVLGEAVSADKVAELLAQVDRERAASPSLAGASPAPAPQGTSRTSPGPGGASASPGPGGTPRASAAPAAPKP